MCLSTAFRHIAQANLLLEDRQSLSARLVEQTFINTDLRIRKNKTVSPAFIYAALLVSSL